ncbi:MAG TPA: Fe-S cluster assembly protein SufD [Alphaproteobacteria bacterium]|nr:Fe-S cluster assembly protein SufD [Alphaproteobacteria bacterium]
MSASSPIVESFARQYDAVKASLPGGELAWLANLRAQAFASFAAKGLPTLKTEAWKYTNLNPLARFSFVAAAPDGNGIAAAKLPRLLSAKAESLRLVIANGRPRPDLSQLDKLPSGVTITSLAMVFEREPALLKDRLASFGVTQDKPLAALNTAFIADGVVLRIGANVSIDRPIELLYVASVDREPVSYHPRSLIVAEAGSRATVVEHHVAVGDRVYLANGVAQIVLEAGATLRHYKLENESAHAFHIANRQVQVAGGATYESFVLSNGGRLARDEIVVTLDGPGATCQLNGAFMARGRQLIDNTTVIDHAKPNTTSREIYKGVLDDQARGVFQGRILVRPDAQKTDGQQTSRTLLLSPAAEIDTKPQLEIYADDVKCGHGAAVGEIEEEALFYLRSRGIPELDARQMLVEAFLDDVVDKVGCEPVREAFRDVVAGWIGSKGGA